MSKPRRAARRKPLPPLDMTISYPEQLPVSARREEIMAAIRDNQVVIVAGETGSGKTTQLPKMCLELGRGTHGMIGHTQPRRIAARSVAERIAHELHTSLGEGIVGYQVRFTREVGENTRLKLMTDGILLAELSHDRLLEAYDTIIIDEAHERSLNIDVILGYLKRILPRRPDLKVIITSATIDVDRFARHFSHAGPDGADQPAPVLEVSGRTYPVEVRYRPLVATPEQLGRTPAATDHARGDARDRDEEDPGELDDLRSIERDETEAILDAVDELVTEGDGDILVFLPGEREIRDTADALSDHVRRLARPSSRPVRILQLFGRLSAADQHRIFEPSGGERRIILATNIAETSLTVPGIRFVIDSGLARISRFSQRTKVQRLPIEPIAQASANQRSGRSGRTSDGVAIRLYSEEDFDARPRYTEPEILRTSLAQVVLQMLSLGLGDIESFPFLDPPDRRAVSDGLRLLDELGAIELDRSVSGGRRLTPTGRTLARLPIEPRLGRMLIEADRRGALREVLVIVSALTVADVREVPLDERDRAREMHRRFEDKDAQSDFLTYLTLWDYIRTLRRDLSGSAFRKRLRAEYLHYVRIREWWDLHAQLKEMTGEAGLHVGNASPATPDRIHQSLLAGLLSHVGLYDERHRDYQGGRGSRFWIFPGSSLKKKHPDYVMASELVETSRLWARTVARIDPAWAEDLGAHVVKRSYSEPHWSSKNAGVMAHEKVTLYGVPIVADRLVSFGKVDPALSRELFIRHALVEGDWRTRHHFFHDNRALLEDARELEHKTRRRDLVVDDETLFDFYDRRIPASILSGRHFDAWWKRQRHETPDLLTFTEDFLVTDEADRISARDFPDSWVQGDITLPLTYAFAPGSAAVERAPHLQTGPEGRRDEGGRSGRGTARGARGGRRSGPPRTVQVRDGVTCTIPLAVLNRVRDEGFDWLVPGLREELITELIRTLPKPLRRHLVPAPERAKAVAAVLVGEDADEEAFTSAVADELVALPDVPDDLPLYGDDFAPDKLPDHLRMHFRVVDSHGRTAGEGDSLPDLTRRLHTKVDAGIRDAADDFTRNGLTEFPAEVIPKTLTRSVGGLRVTGYPALVAGNEDRTGGGGHGRGGTTGAPSVDLCVLATADEQTAAHPAGTVALLQLLVPDPAGAVARALPGPTKLALADSPYATTAALLRDCTAAALDQILAETEPGGAWTREEFDALLETARQEIGDRTEHAVLSAARALAMHRTLQKAVRRTTALSLLDTLTRIRDHADALLGDGFVRRTGLDHLGDLPRYLEAAAVRVDKAADNPNRDAQLEYQLRVAEQAWDQARAGFTPAQLRSSGAREIPWMLEEYRVSLFAQQLGTKYTVSDKRIRKAISEL